MVVPDDMVAMSEYLYVGQPRDTIFDTIHQPSIMFVIDHSGSMWNQSGLDKWGNRFKVTHALIDTIKAYSPYAEVGVTVFNGHLYYDDRDDQIFETIPQDTDTTAYIPLLQLNKDYGGKQGYEVLKKYLQTDTMFDTTGMQVSNGDTTWFVNKSIGLEYKSGWYKEGATNINVGFHAVNKAMRTAKYDKENHFTIFFSDGDASTGTPNPDSYVNDVRTGIPTTFTIYFVKQSGQQAPQELLDMTQNIQNSNYSPTNPKTNLWEFQNTNYDSLMSFLMENVIKEILQKSTHTPTKMIVNSNNNANNWNQEGFTFDNLFPLEGRETKFSYEIEYHVIRDTLNAQTGLLDTIEYDTTTNTKFTVEIDANAGPLDSNQFDVRCWDRTIGFYENGNPVPIVKETMDPLELRFMYSAGDANYGYTKATIEARTVKGGTKDFEKFSLSRNGTFFSTLVPNVVINDNENPQPNDGKLQHFEEDTIVLTFRNDERPKLVLDTLQLRVPTTFAGTVNLEHAFYYDIDADGYVDSISVKANTDIAGGLTTDHLEEMVDKAINLPAFRSFKDTKPGLLSDGFYLTVTEDKGHDPVTYVTKNDIIDIKELSFSTGGKILPKRVPIYDKVAPIIHWKEKSALAILNQDPFLDDTLQVIFSEEVKAVNAPKPFYFYSAGEKKRYEVQLDPIELVNSTTMLFKIESVNNVKKMADGDTLWIQETDRVGDLCQDVSGNTVTNFQNNPNNPKRRLWVERRLLPFTYTPVAVSPVNKNKIIDERFKLPTKYADLLDETSLGWTQKDQDYYGMIINVVPDNVDNVFDNFELQGEIVILDAVGNRVIDKKTMAWDKEKKRLIWAWSVKNRFGRYVGSGMYLCIIELKEITKGSENSGYSETRKLLIGVK